MADDTPRPEEVRALLQLLDDPDPSVYAAVRGRLSEMGRGVLPFLRTALAEADASLHALLQEIIHDLHFTDLEAAWRQVMSRPLPDLEHGAFLLARYRYPELDVARYQAMLDDFAHRAHGRVTDARGIERALLLSDFLCLELGFKGNEDDYYDPDNSCLNWVLENRLGIPISLAVVYLLLGRRLGLPVFGVNMPAHFLVKYEEGRSEVFLDLFHGGVPLSREDGAAFLLDAGIQPAPAHFQAAHPGEILLRMVRNLLAIAEEEGQHRTRDDLSRLLLPWDTTAS